MTKRAPDKTRTESIRKPRVDAPPPPSEGWATTREQLRRIALGLTRTAHDADDLTQQTLTRLLARSPGRVGHMGYVRRTMLRIWLDQQRSLRRRLWRLGRFALTNNAWHVDCDSLSDQDQCGRLRKAIDALPPRQRAVLVLRLVEELDYAEISVALSCSIQTVRAHLHLGRQRVRQMMGEPL